MVHWGGAQQDLFQITHRVRSHFFYFQIFLLSKESALSRASSRALFRKSPIGHRVFYDNTLSKETIVIKNSMPNALFFDKN